MGSKRQLSAPALLLLLSAAASGVAQPVHAPEPDGFWTGELHGPVPATIAGGRVIDTRALAALIQSGGVVLVDVAPSVRKPEGMAPEAWRPPPHRSIPGSVWLADVGAGTLDPAHDAWFRARLAALTQGDLDRDIVIFCHEQCWASWNAAKRAILYGHRRVHWYPDGVEGWQDADLPTATIDPPPPS
jgi:PQQ-dependent catabolism-associated CXXCW motif protein